MERLTNDSAKYFNQISSELSEFESGENWKELFTYTEIPYFLTYAFAYNWSFNSQNSRFRLTKKEWNAEYDHSRFNQGIYNIDRLAIIETEVQLNPEDENFLKAIEWEKINTVNYEGIVLDGLKCTLHSAEQNLSLSWNIDDEMNTTLQSLINRIRNWKRAFKAI